MVHTVELNGENPYIIKRQLPLCIRMLSAKWFVSIARYGSTITKYVNLHHFRPEKGVSRPLRPKGPELGVVIMNIRWPSVSVIRKY